MHARDRTIPTRLRQARRQAKMTWAELAGRTGYSQNYLQQVAYGRRPRVSVDCALAIATVCGVDPAWLVGWRN